MDQFSVRAIIYGAKSGQADRDLGLARGASLADGQLLSPRRIARGFFREGIQYVRYTARHAENSRAGALLADGHSGNTRPLRPLGCLRFSK